jgi:heat shock protein HtpX
MAMIKRVALFLIVNFLVVSVISFLLYVFNIQPFLKRNGIDIVTLAIFCLFWGMGGALISLAMSRIAAKWMLGVQIIPTDSKDPNLRALLETVHQLADKAGLPSMPEVGIYNSPELNAFATGPTKNRALVAVSTGLLQKMGKEEVNGVLAHEITHVANGDMVTMSLLQGIVNAFVMFLARVIAFAVSMAGSKEREQNSSHWMYYVVVFILEIVFMMLGALVIAKYSRNREFRADAGGARLAGAPAMVSALHTLKRFVERKDPHTDQPSINAFKISGSNGFMRYFASHPPLEERIERLENRYRLR